MARAPDIHRLIGDLAREGAVEAVDLAAATARVRLAPDLVTGDIPWLAGRAGATRTWSPPSVGESVLGLCPDADLARAVILGSLSSDVHPPAAATAKTLVDFADGALIGYDPEEHVLTAHLPAGARVTIVAPGGLEFTGDLSVDGDIRATGKLVAQGDVVGAGKSLEKHLHTKVQAGTVVSGPPA